MRRLVTFREYESTRIALFLAARSPDVAWSFVCRPVLFFPFLISILLLFSSVHFIHATNFSLPFENYSTTQSFTQNQYHLNGQLSG
jgi:hypothetical protein